MQKLKIDFFSDINKKDYEILGYNAIDKYMVRVLWWHFFLISLFALGIYFFNPSKFYPSPYSWRNIPLTGIAAVIILGFFFSSVMGFLRGKMKNHYHYRLLMTNFLMGFSYLLAYVTGGSIEAHFHFFIIFALIILYSDWRLGWWAIVAVALHHGILNYFAPHWVYFYGRNDIAFTAHAVMVLIMAIFTTKVAFQLRETLKNVESTNKSLKKKIFEKTRNVENAKKNLEAEIASRTKDLGKKVKELERFNKVSVSRELKMTELKRKIKDLEFELGKKGK